MGFSSVPRLPGWSFQQLICRGFLPPPHCPDMSGPAVSPIDKLRKDSALTPVTSEKPILFFRVSKIVRFCKGLIMLLLRLSGSGFTVSHFALFFISLKIVDESMKGRTGSPGLFVDIFELVWKYIL